MIISETQKIIDSLFSERGIEFFVKREDLIHPTIPGNKWRKLKYNLATAKKRGTKTLLTFGGAYSNHIAAVAHAGKEYGFETLGVIRGEEILPLNPTLLLAKECGMKFHYVSREEYREKHTQNYIDWLRNKFGTFYLIPEGGSNYYAVNGCMEILSPEDKYDYICCPIGTGGTIAGVILSNKHKAKILGFPALKGGEFLEKDVFDFVNLVANDQEMTETLMQNFSLITEYHFGGFAKIKPELIESNRDFYKKYNLKWDLIYNGKMAFGVLDLIQKNYFPKGSKILLIHTGGLQGIKGMEERFKIKIYED